MCPFLPAVNRVWRAIDMLPFREHRDDEFYFASLCYAQSLLSEGKPAQALLQINKSFLADLGNEHVLSEWPPAYRAVQWILDRPLSEGQFLGNPVRHYQHLASRMSGPRSQVRSLRAWGCFHLAEFTSDKFERDELQIQQEFLLIPSLGDVLKGLERDGWNGEADVLRGTFHSSA